MLSVTHDAQRTFTATFTAKSPLADAPLTFHAAFLGSNVHSKVTAGENRGKVLHHDFVVLRLVQKPMVQRYGCYSCSVEMQMPGKVAGASTSIQVAFWVASTITMRSVQAVGGDFMQDA